jgi:AmmeMemoRadiSam system protein B/AmmeMemoRadiSam system protein A
MVVAALVFRRGAVIRPPQVAGSFYPASTHELSAMLEAFLGNAADRRLNGPVRALIAPHAGYVYSGQVAARGYKLLKDRYQRIFILASNHNPDAPPFKLSVSNATHYQTPLGKVRVSRIARELLDHPLFSYVEEAHATHIIEVHLPLLQMVVEDFEIIPIVTGGANREELRRVAGLISEYLDEESLLIVSADLSHYHPYRRAVALDRACIGAIEAHELERVSRCEACGLPAMLVLLEIAGEKGWSREIIDYKNSGDTAGSKDRVVGYSSIVFYEDDLAFHEKQWLLRLSRNVLESRVRSAVLPEVDERLLPERLLKEQGCFVTLEVDHRLRGCIGHLVPQEALYRCVVENTVKAALHDRRFKPVTPSELDEIKIEISALSVPVRLERSSPEQLLDFLTPLKHGVILRNGERRSTFLPQVWEDLPRKRQYLSKLCLKGGLAADCWKDPETEVSTYGATVFDEPARRRG